MLNEVVMLTIKQPCEGGKPYVITKIYKNGSIKITPVRPTCDIRGDLSLFTYDELIAEAAKRHAENINEGKVVIGVPEQFTSDLPDENEISVLIDMVELAKKK